MFQCNVNPISWKNEKQTNDSILFLRGCSLVQQSAASHSKDPNRFFAFSPYHSCPDSIKFFPSQSAAASAVTSVAVHLFHLISLRAQSFLSSFGPPLTFFFLSFFLLLLDSSMVERGKHVNTQKLTYSSICIHLCRWNTILDCTQSVCGLYMRCLL